MSHIIAPSILAADFANLQKECELINESEADWLHIDVMDGVFVPNISFGLPVIAAMKKHCRKTFDVHLMIQNPDRYIQEFKAVGTDILTVHYEACPHLHRTIQAIQAAGMKAGVALNPHTPVSFLQEVIRELDLVLIMSVNPGFGGQKFIPHTYEKVKELRQMIAAASSKCIIEVDGGVTDQNYRQLLDAGADALVAGSYVFNDEAPKSRIAGLKKR